MNGKAINISKSIIFSAQIEKSDVDHFYARCLREIIFDAACVNMRNVMQLEYAYICTCTRTPARETNSALIRLSTDGRTNNDAIRRGPKQ